MRRPFYTSCASYAKLTTLVAVLSDNAAGMHGTDVVYCDADPEQLDAIAPTQPHRNVDLTVIAGDKEGTAHPAYVCVPKLTR